MLTAAGGIGQALNALETRITNLEALAAAGGIWIDDSDGLTIGGVSDMAGISASGEVVITAQSPHEPSRHL